jgi:TolB-like protein
MHELLAAELSKLPGVQVISPSTIRRYQNARIPSAIMARILRAEVILEGTIQKTGGRTRITARLADVHSGKLIWAETYETPAEPGQSLAQTVAAQVGAHLAIRFRR